MMFVFEKKKSFFVPWAFFCGGHWGKSWALQFFPLDIQFYSTRSVGDLCDLLEGRLADNCCKICFFRVHSESATCLLQQKNKKNTHTPTPATRITHCCRGFAGAAGLSVEKERVSAACCAHCLCVSSMCVCVQMKAACLSKLHSVVSWRLMNRSGERDCVLSPRWLFSRVERWNALFSDRKSR